jgi:hypothetical protein
MEESNVQPVRCPVTVCGDIHGQFVRAFLRSSVLQEIRAPVLPTRIAMSVPLATSQSPRSTICQNCSESAGIRRTPTTSSWATMSIAGTTLSRPSLCSSHSSFAIATASPSSAVIMNLDRSRRSMVFTTNVCANTATPTCGDFSRTSLTSYPSPHLSITKFVCCSYSISARRPGAVADNFLSVGIRSSVCTADSRHPSTR